MCIACCSVLQCVAVCCRVLQWKINFPSSETSIIRERERDKYVYWRHIYTSYTRIYGYKCMYKYMYTHTHTCTYTHTLYIQVYIHMYTYLYTHVCVCVCFHMYLAIPGLQYGVCGIHAGNRNVHVGRHVAIWHVKYGWIYYLWHVYYSVL